MSGNIRMRALAQFMGETFSQALDRSLGCIVRWITSNIKYQYPNLTSADDKGTYGGFVIPCLDPVLIIMA